jgi:NitT/TauT family transport system substrate-binding protein
MRLWDNGVQLYSSVYFSLTDSIASEPEVFAAYLRGAGKGWAYVYENPEKSLEILVAEVPNLSPDDEAAALPMLMKYVFTPETKKDGWATFDPANWNEQINLYAELGQFPAGTPKLNDVMTRAILDASSDLRPRIG